ncbi:MAG: DUF5711 family protein [Eubacteriales bacterium]
MFEKLKKQKQDKMTIENNELKKQLRRYRVVTLYKSMAVLLVIIVLGAIVYNQWQSKTYTSYVVKSSVARVGATNSVYQALNENILAYSKDGVSCTEGNGKALWNITYEMQNPILETAGDMVAVADYSGNIIYAIDASGNATEINTNLPIRTLAVSENGVVAAVLEDTSATWIDIYDFDGNKLAYEKSTMEITGYPIAIDFSGELLAVSYLYVDSGTMESNVTFYNFGDVGQNNLNKMVSSYTYANTIVAEIFFMDEDSVFAAGDNRIMFYSGNQKPMHQADRLIDQEIQEVFYNEEYVGVVFLDATGVNKYSMEIYNSQGNAIEVLGFDIEYKDIIFNDTGIIIYNETECHIYTVKGQLKYEGIFESEVKAVIPGKNMSKYYLITSDKIEAIVLQ